MPKIKKSYDVYQRAHLFSVIIGEDEIATSHGLFDAIADGLELLAEQIRQKGEKYKEKMRGYRLTSDDINKKLPGTIRVSFLNKE